MAPMLAAFAKSFGQLADPRLRAVMWRTFLWAALAFAVLVALAWTVVVKTALFEIGWLELASDVLGGALALVLAFLLFPGIVSAIVGFYLEEVAEAVDARHYDDLPAARGQPVSEAIGSALRLLTLTALLNIAALPLYVLLPGINLFVFYGLNGYLLGREYFEQAAARRMGPGAARELRRQNGLTVTLAGAAVAALLSIPVAGWFMPVVATAVMVHLVETLRTRPAR